MALNVPITEQEQLERIEETKNANLLLSLPNPKFDSVIRKCLSIDGNAIRHLLRPGLEYQRLAVTTTPTAIIHCAPMKRMVDGPVHPSVQLAAFDADPLVLVYAPQRFDESLERHTRAGIRAFAENTISAMLGFIGENSLSANDQDNIRVALQEYIQKGTAQVPVFDCYYTSFPKDKSTWRQIEKITDSHAERVALAEIYLRTKRIPTKDVLDLMRSTYPDYLDMVSMVLTSMSNKPTEAGTAELPTL